MVITVVFLAAGRSTRYRRSKQLEPVGPGGQSLLDYGVFDALRGGVDRIIIVTGPGMQPAFEAHFQTVFGSLAVEFALQESLEGRPGGTGHAVLAAASLVQGPFAVANADDFYGPASWQKVLGFLGRVPSEGGSHAVIGYPLASTLSSSGGVSRAVCRVDDRAMVQEIREWHDVRHVGDNVEGTDLDGARAILEREAPVSMNLWGFTPALLGPLRSQFERFRQLEADRGTEFLLSEAVNGQVQNGEATVRLLPTHEAWFGLTHPADRSTVRARLDTLTSGGIYPARFDLNPPG